MKSYIYMNHHIRDRNNLQSDHPEPVITVQQGRRRIYCNAVEIKGSSTVRFGRFKSHGHQVHSWIETESEVLVTK